MVSRFEDEQQKESESVEKQYIMFTVGDQQFGVEIMQTREIINMTELTDMPSSPDFVKGVVNLRGEIVPIVDLEKKLMIDKGGQTEKEGRIIVVSINDNLVGMQVNQVEGIIRLNNEDIGKAPELSKGIKRNYIKGVGKLEDNLLIILDLASVLTPEEVEKLEEFEPNQGE